MGAAVVSAEAAVHRDHHQADAKAQEIPVGSVHIISGTEREPGSAPARATGKRHRRQENLKTRETRFREVSAGGRPHVQQ